MTAAAPVSSAAPVLRLTRLGKTFPGQVALAGIDLTVAPGEIHALLGENGSGKSTLIKCLAGVHSPDPGSEIRVAGRVLPAEYRPSDAGAHGLCFVHQDLGVIPSLTVLENLALSRGFVTRRRFRIDWAAERRRATAVLHAFDVDLDLDVTASQLAATAQVQLAIARSLDAARRDGRVLVLDEPTAALPDTEAEKLFGHLRLLAVEGVAIIYVSHRLDEILRIADRATILRDGHKVVTIALAGLEESDLVALLVGGVPDDRDRPAPSPDETTSAGDVADDPVMELRKVSGAQVHDISLSLHRGTIVGLAGLAGSGRSEVARILAGAIVPTSGTVAVDGKPVTFDHPARAIERGIVYVPQDRRRSACILGETVGRNVTLPSVRSLTRHGVVRRREERALAALLTSAFNVRPADPERELATLSGGNQQKVVLAKWLHRSPRVLVLDEPVQGIDVGAKAEVYGLVRDAVDRGAAALLIDSDFENLARVCDRVVVLRAGQTSVEVSGGDLTRDRLVQHVFDTEATS